MQYSFDIQKVIRWLLPATLRQLVMTAWLEVLNAPLAYLHKQFYIYHFLAIQEIYKNGQVIVLRKALSQYAKINGGFRPPVDGWRYPVPILYNPLIIIEDYPFNIELPGAVLLNEKLIEGDLLSVGLLSEGVTHELCLIEETESDFDFQVKIHQSLVKDVSFKTLRSVVDKYKIVGRTYKVLTYQS